MKPFNTIAIAIFFIAASPQIASACTTQPMPPANFNQAAESNVVFKGIAISTQKASGDFSVTVFKVIKKEKGFFLGKEVSVKHRTTQKFCQMEVHFKPNKEYIVYAKRMFWGGLYIKQPSYMNQ